MGPAITVWGFSDIRYSFRKEHGGIRDLGWRDARSADGFAREVLWADSPVTDRRRPGSNLRCGANVGVTMRGRRLVCRPARRSRTPGFFSLTRERLAGVVGEQWRFFFRPLVRFAYFHRSEDVAALAWCLWLCLAVLREVATPVPSGGAGAYAVQGSKQH